MQCRHPVPVEFLPRRAWDLRLTLGSTERHEMTGFAPFPLEEGIGEPSMDPPEPRTIETCIMKHAAHMKSKRRAVLYEN